MVMVRPSMKISPKRGFTLGYLSPECGTKGGGRADLQVWKHFWTKELLWEGKRHSIRGHCA